MTQNLVYLAAIISNIAALILFFTSWKNKELARILFSILFLWAAFANWRMAHNNPADYLNYSQYAVGFYKRIIQGIFAAHITGFVSLIAVCQLLTGLGFLGRGLVVKLSCVAATIFLLAIAPLGLGAAFPFSIIASLGLIILYRFDFKKDILHNKWFA